MTFVKHKYPSRSISAYRKTCEQIPVRKFLDGANDGNRTHNHSLGSCCFTTKLHSRLGSGSQQRVADTILPIKHRKVNCFKNPRF